MRIVTIFERAFLSLIGVLMLWSASHWATDGMQLRRSHEPGAASYLLLSAVMVLVASFLIFVGVRGRAPRWTDRFSLPGKRN